MKHTTQEREGQFEQFWEAYPRKVSKKAARGMFARSLRVASFDEIMRGLLAQTQNGCNLDKPDPTFIPHAATWLNQERWTDAIECRIQSRNGIVGAAVRSEYGTKMQGGFGAYVERISSVAKH